MSDKYADRILESGLEEVLGGHYPPDLTSAILQAREARRQAAERLAWIADDVSPVLAEALVPIAPPLHPLAEPVPPPRHNEEGARVSPAGRSQRNRRSRWVPLAVLAGFLAVAGTLGLYVVQHLHQPAGDIIARPEGQVLSPDGPPVFRPLAGATDQPPSPDGTPARPPNAPPGPSPLAADRTHGLLRVPDPTRPADAAEMPAASPPPRQPSPDREVIAFVDDVLKRGWQEHSVTPSPALTDEQWCERVYRQLTGRLPTTEETRQFLRQRDKDQSHRRALVDRLLSSDEHAQHWAELWATVLVGPATGESANGTFSRDDLLAYLTEAVRMDRPQEQIVSELLSASGAQQPGAEDHHGAVSFLLSGAEDHAVAATNRTARVFLGKQLVCTSCHEHSTGGWEQGEFWQLNAFFRQMTVQRDRAAQRIVLTDRDYAGASGAAKDAELFYRLPDGRLGMAYPRLGGQAIPHSGLVADVQRRRELAKLVVASEDFPRATVNRVWSWLLGYGFTQPVDDMGPHNPPSHPELLERLAGELAAHDFDTKSLIRWIVLSEAFGLSGKRTPESWMDAPESGGPPLFARYYARENGGQEKGDVSRMLVQAVHRRPAARAAVPGALARRTWLRPSAEPLEIIETQPESQWPGPAWLPRLARSSLAPEKKIEHLFLSVLDRRPTSRELTAAKLVLADRLGDPSAIREIWQTLLASQSLSMDSRQR